MNPIDMTTLDAALAAPDFSHARWSDQSRTSVNVYRYEPGFGPALVGIFTDAAASLAAARVTPEPARTR